MTLRHVDSEVGEYRVSLRDANGRELRNFVRATNQRYPVIGEALCLYLDEDSDDLREFRIYDVHHVEEDTFSAVRLTTLVVLVREVDEPGSPEERDDNETFPTRRSSREPTGRATAHVIPFRPVSFDASSPLLSFFSLVAGVVVGGYLEQSNQFEQLKFAAWGLEWAGQRWVVRQLSGLSADDLRALSREAAREGDIAADSLRRSLSAVATSEQQGNLVVVSGGRESA